MKKRLLILTSIECSVSTVHKVKENKNKIKGGIPLKGMNREAIIKLCGEIAAKEGGDSIFSLGSSTGILKIQRWSTGLDELDNIIGGGLPKGRTIEIYGAESAGKTALALHLCGLHDFCLYVPAERTFDGDRARVFGNRPKQMIVYSRGKGEKPLYGENIFNKMIRFAEAGIPLEVVDSVPSMQPREDIENVKKAVHNDTDVELRIGGVARLMAKYLPTLEDIIEQTGTTVVFINQIRDKIGSFGYGDNITTPGGHKFAHSMSLRLKVARKSWIDIPNKNIYNTSEKEKIGMIMKVRVVKSKVSDPYGECELPLFFDRGFVSFTDVDRVRKEIMKERKERYS